MGTSNLILMGGGEIGRGIIDFDPNKEIPLTRREQAATPYLQLPASLRNQKPISKERAAFG